MNDLSVGHSALREIVNASGAPQPSGAGAEGIVLHNPDRLLLLSGQVPADETGRCPSAFSDQCRLAWKNVELQLTSVGRSLDDVVEVTTFLADRRYADENMAIRNEIMAGRKFANTVVIAGLYDADWLIEVKIIAAWSDRSAEGRIV
jgi:enamine deaminase RidA (YjgF/YER057c/UK114 family)